AEYVVRGVGILGAGAAAEPDPPRIVRDLQNVVLPSPSSSAVEGPNRGGRRGRGGPPEGSGGPTTRPPRPSDVARRAAGAQIRRGVLEKDGNEVVGGVVLMRYGENPLEVTRRIKAKIQELQAGLPPDMRIVPFYDRTPLIEGAIGTVTTTVLEAMITATICVVVILLHLRTSFIIAVTLPLAALSSFVIMWTLRKLGIA